MRSNSVLDMQMKNPFGDTKMCNPFSFYAEDNWVFLKSIYDKQVPMFSQAYSILANTMEQFYKGVYVELLKIHPDMPVAEEFELNGHHFDNFIRKINRYIPVSSSREGYFKILDNSERIQRGYTDSKYHAYYGYDDFEKDFRRYEVQRERLYKALDMERQKFEAKDVMSIAEDKTENDDLGYYK